ncbi:MULTISPECIES: histidinol-phosphate transaminase [unclassified Polaromonas]|jgi:histidinol-phosphate aminotransferase|uniref:histidinol-phosphate transaminase n=1 Tax=unclassified Polaromonas TaxID=2638319 RepID=UPI000BDCBE32|nr:MULTISPECIES: histidinol-phosphate transaminase [unclassified Polaromonas]OYY35903.1 MAG: histidinol-phosphate transaminase [Polaromonas sp. 35-63-35]OYZ19792.1 MAG: histidinol-phosphate transaminase [Polaromonas sp. 16-63-31]OYZ79940.1 MAG: histidinol-phosphate transaminase [Polaromonas sp. 24-63-21]OZA52057.1 MAG: histidinol-phosphate transaminase [Polaromonas sp. 17-63-33]OZA87911.1 MAG: histidinol-phosphate transaminase [Polaromonas sp. 39-63-25]
MNDVAPGLKKLIRQDVLSMHAYAIQDSAGLIKLDAMENPHRLPPALQAQLGQRLGALALNRYPDGRVNDLRQALAGYANMPEGFDIMLGNGSDELISLLAMACDVPGASILAPLPGFVMYAMSAQLQGLKFIGVPLTADFELDEAAMLAAIAEHQPSIIYIAYPNNPTANLWDDAVIEKVIAAAPGLVVIDEAYQPFSSKSYIDRIGRHSHVLLMRTLSKFGLAGVRIGYMMGPKALIAEIDKVRPPYNISVLNYECALFALEHAEVFGAQAQEIRAQRAILFEALQAMAGVRAWKSDANMILVRVPDAQKTFEGMRARKVLVKNVSKMHPLLANCLRLTVGTADDNVQMLAALKESL